MKKPTAEEWEKAWDNFFGYMITVKGRAESARLYFGDAVHVMMGLDPRNQPDEPEQEASKEPQRYTLTEIVGLAEPGDEFTSPAINGIWTLDGLGCFRDVQGGPALLMRPIIWSAKTGTSPNAPNAARRAGGGRIMTDNFYEVELIKHRDQWPECRNCVYYCHGRCKRKAPTLEDFGTVRDDEFCGEGLFLRKCSDGQVETLLFQYWIGESLQRLNFERRKRNETKTGE